MIPVLTFRVEGDPAPQGSKKAFRHRTTGKIIVKEQSQRVAPWRNRVEAAGKAAIRRHGAWVTLDEPVQVIVTFRFPRPKSHYGTGRNAALLKASAPAKPTAKNLGDVDKLERSTFDALTSAAVFADDSLVTLVTARKVWAELGGEAPGATITVRPDVTEAEAAA